MRTDSLGGGVANLDILNEQMMGIYYTDGARYAPPGHSTSKSSASAPEEAAPVSVPATTNLTPEGLMAYCQSRLKSLDTQMTNIFNEQQGNSTVTQDIDSIAGLLNDAGNVPGQSSSNTNPNIDVTGTYQQIIGGYTQAIADANQSGNAAIAGQLNTDLTNFENDIGYTGQPLSGTVSLSSNDVQGLQQNLKNYGNELNSDSEMSMINLQSLMSQRETAVQLTTNLVQSLGQQSQDIAKNIGQ
jgi:hypothetical protein